MGKIHKTFLSNFQIRIKNSFMPFTKDSKIIGTLMMIFQKCQ